MYLQIENIRKSFGSGENKVDVLKDINFEAEKGDIVVLLGPSGSGKSTLLNIIGELKTTNSGRIKVGKQRVEGLTQRQLETYRRKHLGYIFQATQIGRASCRERV